MSTPANILILTSGSLARNPRPAKEAAALAAAGHRVTVLHPGEGEANDRIDRDLAERGGFANPVLDQPVGGRLFRRRLGRWLAIRAIAVGLEDVAALGPGRALLARAARIPADLTIVHNEIALWAGRRLLGRRRVAADIEDWYSEDLPEQERRHRPLRLLRALERRLLAEAAYVSTTSAALRNALLERHGGKPAVVITNSFPLQPDPRTVAPVDGTLPAFFWFSQTIGPGRGLENFISVWSALSSPSRLILLGEIRREYSDHLRGLIPRDKRGLIAFLPTVPPGELPSVIARHDIGLALEDSSIPSRDFTITNKILQYLNAGLAVVATPTAGQREVLQAAPEAGFIFNPADPLGSSARLNALLKDRPQLRAAQQAARAAAEATYCWEREAPRLVQTVERALAS